MSPVSSGQAPRSKLSQLMAWILRGADMGLALLICRDGQESVIPLLTAFGQTKAPRDIAICVAMAPTAFAMIVCAVFWWTLLVYVVLVSSTRRCARLPPTGKKNYGVC